MQETESNQVQIQTPSSTVQTSPPIPPAVSPAPESNIPQKSPLKKILITLIVLSFVITIVAVGLYFYRSQSLKKRDGQRKANITAIQGALEKYKGDTLNAQYYPTVLNPSTLEETGYMSKIPADPKNAIPYVYTYLGSPSPCAGGCTGYTLTACLENKNDKGKNTTSPIAPCTTRSYLISKP